MNRILVRAWLAVAAWTLVAPCRAAEGRLPLAVLPPVTPGVAAMPRLAHPANEAERRINAALARLDDTVRRARAGCEGAADRSPSWQRTVEVPMRGPRFLSYVVTEDVDCGGAHPNGSTWAVVYDLRSGRPVDWTALLPRALTGTPGLARAEDGTRTVQLASLRLWALYRAGYDHGDDPRENTDCREALDREGAGGPPPMSAWLDGRQGGLVLHIPLPHTVQNCAEPVVVPAATLRRERASPELTGALDAARVR